MGRILILFLACVYTFGNDHTFILKFEQPTDIHALLNNFDLVSSNKLASQEAYRVVISSDLSKKDLKAKLSALSAVEDNHGASLVTLEGAALLDQRGILILDDLETAYIDQRGILILDEIGDYRYAPLFQQDHVAMVKAWDVWPYAQGEGVVVAVIDTGVDVEHEFLAANISHLAYDFVDDDFNPQDEAIGLDSNGNGVADEGWGHGTHVAGIIKTVAPKAEIMPLRVADSDGEADLFNIVRAVEYAILNGAHVINLSMSIDEPSPLLQQWLELAQWVGVVVVTSAGNQNNSDLKFPAAESEVITVTSINADLQKSSFANFGTRVDVAAPGEHVISCLPGNRYVMRSGTSMSAPIVAGHAAIILDMVPSASVNYVQGRVRNTAFGINDFNPAYRNKLGKGLVDFWNSVTLASQ